MGVKETCNWFLGFSKEILSHALMALEYGCITLCFGYEIFNLVGSCFDSFDLITPTGAVFDLYHILIHLYITLVTCFPDHILS